MMAYVWAFIRENPGTFFALWCIGSIPVGVGITMLAGYALRKFHVGRV